MEGVGPAQASLSAAGGDLPTTHIDTITRFNPLYESLQPEPPPFVELGLADTRGSVRAACTALKRPAKMVYAEVTWSEPPKRARWNSACGSCGAGAQKSSHPRPMRPPKRSLPQCLPWASCWPSPWARV